MCLKVHLICSTSFPFGTYKLPTCQSWPLLQVNSHPLMLSNGSDICIDTSRKFVYLVHVKPEDYLVDIRGGPYSRAGYYSQPEMFNSLFYQRVSEVSDLAHPTTDGPNSYRSPL